MTLLAVATLASCDGDDIAAPTPMPQVEIVPPDVGLVPGGTLQLSATVLDPDGQPSTDQTIDWSSSDTSVVVVDSTGQVTAKSVGSARVTAGADDATGSISVDVRLNTYTDVTSGWQHRCALAGDGSAWCWGDGRVGQLGNGTQDLRTRPTRVAEGHTFVELAAGGRFTCAVTVEGDGYCWGSGENGELGNPAFDESALPVPVQVSFKLRSISGGSRHACAVTVDDVAYCWGHNEVGQLGDSTTTDRHTPTAVAGGLAFQVVSAGGTAPTHPRAHTCGITVTGAAYCWGHNWAGQLGDGTTRDTTMPVPVTGGLSFRRIDAGTHSFSCGVTTDDVAYCWGHNDLWQLGRGDQANAEPFPESVVDLPSATRIDGAEFHTCALALDGSAYCWGESLAALGHGAQEPSPTAGPVVGGHTWQAIATGADHTCAVTVDGVLYCWGTNSGDGLLGVGEDERKILAPRRVVGQP